MDSLRVVARRFSSALAALCLMVSSARADETPRPRVRIREVGEPREIGGRTLQGSRLITGVVTSSTDDSVTVFTANGVRVISIASISSVEREAGKRRHPLIGAVIGAPIGALVGLAAANATNDNEQEVLSILPFVTNAQGTENTGEWALAGAGIGAALGAIFGYLVQTDRWQAMPTSELQLHATISPAGSGCVGVAFQF